MATYKIGENSLIRQFTKSIAENFWFVNSQYIHADENSWNNAIWTIGEFAKHRNKSYNNNGLIPIPTEKPETLISNKLEIMLQQGFKFSSNGCIGIHCIIADLDSGEILISQLLTEDDFHVTSDRLLIDGSFWMTAATIYIPEKTGTLCASLTELTAEDINFETGLIHNFVAPKEVLIDKKLMIETIKTNVEIDENFYLSLSLNTKENKSVEQALIDYIGHEPADLRLNYIINYGNEEIGYKELEIANSINNFAPIKIGLDLSNWKEDSSEIINIRVTTNITYENNPMVQETLLTTNVRDVINPIINRLLESNKPDTVYPVNVTIENKVEQTVVKTNIDREVVQILQPVFCEMITNSIVIENKHIVFENFNQSGYLVISETKKLDQQILKNDITVDNRYYFDLSKLQPVDENTTYLLLDEHQQMILGRGYVYVKNENQVVPATDKP